MRKQIVRFQELREGERFFLHPTPPFDELYGPLEFKKENFQTFNCVYRHDENEWVLWNLEADAEVERL